MCDAQDAVFRTFTTPAVFVDLVVVAKIIIKAAALFRYESIL